MREFGIKTGILKPGKWNAITDVEGVKVGHVTLIRGKNIRTGVTAILPHVGNVFQEKVPAAIYIANGYGKLIGYTQVDEMGNLETPIILTNTLSVPIAADAVTDYILFLPGNEEVISVNAVEGETNDSWLNDIRGKHVKKEHVIEAIKTQNLAPWKKALLEQEPELSVMDSKEESEHHRGFFQPQEAATQSVFLSRQIMQGFFRSTDIP